MKRSASILLSAILFSALLASRSAHAMSPITWGSAQNITGDSDVSTLGTLLYAYNIRGPGGDSHTVNGVSFSPFQFPENFSPNSNTVTVGDVTFVTGNNLLHSNSMGGQGSFSSLSNQYQHVLGTGGFSNASQLRATLGGLTVGQDYLVQWWTNDSTFIYGNFDSTAAGWEFFGFNPEVTLDANTAGATGGLGQYAIGTFTATGTSVILDLQGQGGYPLINAIQVRNIPSAAVPEPGQVAASLLLLAGIGGYVWLKRRKAAKAATA
jgi:hypothetical protein